MPWRRLLLWQDRIGTQSAIRYVLRASGFLLRPSKRSLWVHVESPAQFDSARRLIQDAMRERPHVRLVLSSSSPATLEYLAAAFPDDMACPAPWRFGPAFRRFVVRLKPGMVLLLDGGKSLDRQALRELLSKRIQVAVVNIGSVDEISRNILEACDSDSANILLCMQSRESFDSLAASGVPVSRMAITGPLDLEPDRPSQQTTPPTLCQLVGLTGRELILIGAAIAEEDEAVVLQAFARVRAVFPETRLILEPLHRSQASRIQERIREHRWIGYRRTDPRATPPTELWDVLIVEIAGELLSLMPLGFATIVGGNAEWAVVAAAITAGNWVIGANRDHLRHPSVLESTSATIGDLLANLAARGTPMKLHQNNASARTLAALRDRLPESPALPRVRQDWRIPSLRDRGGRSRLWKSVARPLMTRRIDDWGALRHRLGEPKSILCLGNGPSSEDSRLRDVRHDCLMRVNWRWANRGFLTRPDMVFVGDMATIHKVPPCVFGLWNIPIEYSALLRHALLHGFRRMEYVTMERLSPDAASDAWLARPSNGALMVLAAAALEPERLIIGGIDLFLHQDGRYPGDLRSRNEYCHAHSRDTDLAIIQLALERFSGEVVIVSDVLQDSLARHREFCHHGA